MENSEQLVKKFQSRSDKKEGDLIFSRIYNKYINLVLYAVNKFKNDLSEDEIKEAVHETFILISNKLDSFKWTVEKAFTTWIYYIAQKKGLEAIKKKNTNPELTYDIEKEKVLTDNSDVTSKAVSELCEIWKRFDSQGYKINDLFFFENYSDKMIAKILNVSTSAATKRRQRAKENFKNYLEHQYQIKSITEWIEKKTIKK